MTLYLLVIIRSWEHCNITVIMNHDFINRKVKTTINTVKLAAYVITIITITITITMYISHGAP